jgi:hypothetical protein
MRRDRGIAIHWFKHQEKAMKTHLYPDRLPMSRPSKRLRMISLALVRVQPIVDSSMRDLDVLLDSFLFHALTLDLVSRIVGIDSLPERHKAFALELEGRSVRWRAWNASGGIWLMGGTLNASRSDRVRGAVIYLEWMDPESAVHRSWWYSLNVGEWIAGLGR